MGACKAQKLQHQRIVQFLHCPQRRQSPQVQTQYRQRALAALRHPGFCAKAMKKLTRLRDCEVHSTVILGEQDAATYARLGMRVTCTPKYQSKNLFHR